MRAYVSNLYTDCCCCSQTLYRLLLLQPNPIQTAAAAAKPYIFIIAYQRCGCQLRQRDDERINQTLTFPLPPPLIMSSVMCRILIVLQIFRQHTTSHHSSERDRAKICRLSLQGTRRCMRRTASNLTLPHCRVHFLSSVEALPALLATSWQN
jgi:hypothetical protein